jgi:molecular chaperone DnaK
LDLGFGIWDLGFWIWDLGFGIWDYSIWDAVQAGILANEATGIKLADVVPLSLGINTKGRMDTLIPRNTRVPIVKTRVYTTAYDNQERVEIQIYQGERPLVQDNVKLGAFTLVGIEPARAGEPEIEITFSVDQDGILHVTGKDLRTENSKEITITDSVRLSEEEIAAMIADAEQHAEEYATQRRQAEAREQCESLRERLKQMLSEQAQTLPADLANDIRDVLQLPEAEDWQARLDRLQTLWRRGR